MALLAALPWDIRDELYKELVNKADAPALTLGHCACTDSAGPWAVAPHLRGFFDLDPEAHGPGLRHHLLRCTSARLDLTQPCSKHNAPYVGFQTGQQRGLSVEHLVARDADLWNLWVYNGYVMDGRVRDEDYSPELSSASKARKRQSCLTVDHSHYGNITRVDVETTEDGRTWLCYLDMLEILGEMFPQLETVRTPMAMGTFGHKGSWDAFVPFDYLEEVEFDTVDSFKVGDIVEGGFKIGKICEELDKATGQTMRIFEFTVMSQ